MLKHLRIHLLYRFTQKLQANTSQNITKSSQNNNNYLINPQKSDPIAYGYHFPKQFTIDRIYSILDPSRKQITSIKLINNKLGKPSGKILFTFKSLDIMKKYCQRYNQDYIQTQDSVHRVILKQFQLKTQQKKRNLASYSKKYGVHLTNLDFDIDYLQLERLAEDFGEIQYIDLPMKSQLLNKGAAKVYFKNKKSQEEFKQFTDGLVYKERKFKSAFIKNQSQLNNNKEIQLKEPPKIFMKWNEHLYKRMITKQVQMKQHKVI